MSSTTQIPTKQTVALSEAHGAPLKIVHDYPVPQIQPNQVLARVLYSGVCLTDVHTCDGTIPAPEEGNLKSSKFPLIAGHEGVGRVVSVGADLKESVEIGQLVGVPFVAKVCGICEYCLTGSEEFCTGGRLDRCFSVDGSFQQYIALDGRQLCRLPMDVNPAEIAPVLCAGVTSYKAIKICEPLPGQWVVIYGAGGGTGHFGIQYAKAFGCKVIAVDDSSKESFCYSVGADKFVNYHNANQVDIVIDITGGGAHAVVVFANFNEAFDNGARMVRTKGALSLVGIPAGHIPINVSISRMVFMGMRILGSLVGSLQEHLEAVELVRMGLVKPVIRVCEFEELPRIFEELEEAKILGRVVVKLP